MLRDGQRHQRPVKDSACVGQPVLPNQELKVVQPDAGHLVHGHQRAVKRVVQSCHRWVGNGEAADSFQAFFQVRVPKLQQGQERKRVSFVVRAAKLLAAILPPVCCRGSVLPCASQLYPSPSGSPDTLVEGGKPPC